MSSKPASDKSEFLAKNPPDLDLSPEDLKKYLSQPLRSIFREQAKSIVAIKELQHEVSSLLEFKNALLETFPHLQSRMSASSNALHASSHLSGSTGRLSALDPGLGGSTGQLHQSHHGYISPRGMLLGHPQPYVAPARHLDMVSSDDTQPSWTGMTGTHPATGQASSSGVSSGPPGSSSNPVSSLRAVIRSGLDLQADLQDQDELMHLLNLIHLKSEKLKSEIAQDKRLSSTNQLHAINEDQEGNRVGLEAELEQLRREKFLLLQRISELESANSRINNSSEPHASSNGDSESSISGIVHSVHIRTGGESAAGGGIVGVSSPASRKTRSVSHTDLDKPSGAAMATAGVQIEIKNLSKSHDHLAGVSSTPTRSKAGHHHQRRLSASTAAANSSTTVVNLNNQLPHKLASSSGDLTTVKGRFHNSNNKQLTFGTKSQLLQAQRAMPASSSSTSSSLLPGRMMVGSVKAGSQKVPSNSGANNKLKSHSVENLIDPGSTVLGLKPANSEMNVINPHHFLPAGRRRLSGTSSELTLTRIGTSEKVKLFETLEGVAVTSLPVELTQGIKGQVKPNRDKIRAILGMNNIIELQRHLLTTVMENEVYKTQLERVSESWNSKMSSFEKLNSGLRNSLAELQEENLELKTQVTKKEAELVTTKARLRLLEQNVTNSAQANSSPLDKSKSEDLLLRHEVLPPYSKSSESHRVHFDLNNSTTTEIKKPARATRPNGAPPRPSSVHLPSDARQRLEQLASAAGVSISARSAERDPSSRLGSPIRSNLDPIQEMTLPSRQPASKRQQITSSLPVSNGTSAVVTVPAAVSSVNNNNKNNGPVSRVRRESLGSSSSSRSRPNTPSGRDVRALNLNNLSKSHHLSSTPVEMPTEQASPVDLMNSMDKKASGEDLTDLGRETIADLIAGIIKRNSISEVIPREAFVDSETETEFTEVTLSSNNPELAAAFLDPEEKQLFSRRKEFHSLPHTSLPSTALRPSWEANNLMEEVTNSSHLMVPRRSTSSSYTMELDSLSARYNQTEEPDDSLDFNLQEAIDEEDSLAPDYDHDSLQVKQQQPAKEESLKELSKKKLIIPYNESFSSTNSIFTTSQDGSLDSCNNKNQQEDSLTHMQSSNLNMAPIKPWLNELTSQVVSCQAKLVQSGGVKEQQLLQQPVRIFNPNQPLIIGQDYQQQHLVKPVRPVHHHPVVQSAVAEPVTSPSLMRLATERMKRKFLGWN